MKLTRNTFVTADTHFGHDKMVNVWHHRAPGHEDRMVERWNSVVNKHDRVLHLGDLTMTNKERTHEWTRQLRGDKYLVRGNHDGHSVGWFADVGFTVIPNCHRQFGETHVVFTHIPILPLPFGWLNIHGHLHGDNHRKLHTTPQHYDAGVDANNYTPITIGHALDVLAHNKEEGYYDCTI